MAEKWQIEDFDFKKNNNVLYLYMEHFFIDRLCED